MTSDDWKTLKADVERFITIASRQNNCTEEDVINVMSAVASERLKDKDSMYSSLQGRYKG